MNHGKPNRLASEGSPYLRQHANNPVDWYPWGEEAFEKARRESKPIFLSIGYSTCHWCHVMEHESFEDESVADFLNQHFVSIKVDREERPDLDHIYMSAVQAISGSGGWPMTLFLTPDLKPFFGGTYFPSKAAYGRPSFMQLAQRISELWQSERAKIVESSIALTAAISREQPARVGEAESWDAIAVSAFNYFSQVFDTAEGGFGGAPKFPRVSQFDFLFDYYYLTGEIRARDMTLFTLEKMARGGIRDHLGGGFHRYSVDAFWRVSHFEKMLYDQAQLLNSYLDAYQITGEEIYAGVAKSIIEYLRRDMTHPSGALFSAEDADSEGVEGSFYVWSRDEFDSILGKDANIVAEYFGVTEEGNFEHGKSVLYLAATVEQVAGKFGIPDAEALCIIDGAKAKLLSRRSKRVRPLLDDKILTSWNGLAIAALSRAGAVLKDSTILENAISAAEFIWEELHENTENGLLLHRWHNGDARFSAYLDDYAFLIRGFLQLYHATFENIWLERAIQLQEEQNRLLFDAVEGGYFMSRNSNDVIARLKADYDGAEPSGNSISVQNLLELSSITGKSEYKLHAEMTLRFFHQRASAHPYAMPVLLVGGLRSQHPPLQIVLSGTEAHEMFGPALNSKFLPGSILIAGGHSESIDPFYRTLTAIGDRPTAYLCHNFVCELPVHTPVDLLRVTDRSISRENA